MQNSGLDPKVLDKLPKNIVGQYIDKLPQINENLIKIPEIKNQLQEQDVGQFNTTIPSEVKDNDVDVHQIKQDIQKATKTKGLPSFNLRKMLGDLLKTNTGACTLASIAIFNSAYYIAYFVYLYTTHEFLIYSVFGEKKVSFLSKLTISFVAIMIYTCVIACIIILVLLRILKVRDIELASSILTETILMSSIGMACGYAVTFSCINSYQLLTNKIDYDFSPDAIEFYANSTHDDEEKEDTSKFPYMAFFFNLTTVVADIGTIFWSSRR